MATRALVKLVMLLGLTLALGRLAGAEDAVASAGRVVIERVDAPSLARNQLGDAAERLIAVYLPPSYDRVPDRRYPVVYFLGGYGDTIEFYLTGRYQGFALPQTLDREIAAGRIEDMIMVVVSGYNRFRGSFYVNSPVTGNWEQHVVEEVVGHVDGRFRTRAQPESRGLAGHSMGGFGALNLAMRHPDVFGWCYALSPGLLAPDGLADLHPFENGARITAFLEATDAWKGLPLDRVRQAARAWADRFLAANDWPTIFTHAYGAAFAPSRGETALGFDYPFSNEPDGLQLDAQCWWRWEAGFGELDRKVSRYQRRPVGLRGLALECGRHDENGWIPRGCEAFAGELKAAGIAGVLTVFDGRHEDQLGERIAAHALPYFSARLAR